MQKSFASASLAPSFPLSKTEFIVIECVPNKVDAPFSNGTLVILGLNLCKTISSTSNIFSITHQAITGCTMNSFSSQDNFT